MPALSRGGIQSESHLFPHLLCLRLSRSHPPPLSHLVMHVLPQSLLFFEAAAEIARYGICWTLREAASRQRIQPLEKKKEEDMGRENESILYQN